MDVLGGESLRAKSGLGDNLAILLVPGSLTQISPDESTIASRGYVRPSPYSVNGPLREVEVVLIDGVTVEVNTLA
jgi:hypothetical protein